MGEDRQGDQSHALAGDREIAAAPLILAINGGSSSIKFAAFTAASDSCAMPSRLLSGAVDRIGSPQGVLTATRSDARPVAPRPLVAGDHEQAGEQLIAWLREEIGGWRLAGIGHRIVHGGLKLTQHQRISDSVLDELLAAQALDLAHLPREISLIRAFGKEFPGLPQFACFDTAFHRNMPRVAQLLPIPRHYLDQGIRRLGFHGLSYTYLLDELSRVAGQAVASGKIIFAHLGSGASLAAVRNGKPIETTMGFTPTGGLVMGTRPGDLDPGLLVYLARGEKMTPEQMDELISRHCGLMGVSQISSDVRTLSERSNDDPRAAEALALFVYQARKWIGALAATLGGLDTLVFSGGVGEHAHLIRAEICAGLEFLGIHLDPGANAGSHPIISMPGAPVTARVIPTDEEIVIAQIVCQLLEPS